MDTISTNRTSIAGRVSTLPSEIDRIMAKIDQDNRVLAELDKTRSTIGENDIRSCEVYTVNIKIYRMFNIYVNSLKFELLILMLINYNTI